MEHSRQTMWDRVGITAVALLIVAFLFGGMTPLLTSAGAGDSITGTRDDDGRELVAVEDDDDDDDDDEPLARNASNSRSRAGSNSGQRSIGSRSANTRTGSTQGTGKSRSISNSRDRSRNTRTGTTRGTGKSRSISNSS